MVPALEDVVALPAGAYRLGEPGEERVVELIQVQIGRHPVVNAHIAHFATATGRSLNGPLRAKLTSESLADHPATDLTLADAEAFCDWASAELRVRVRLPRSDEWEALARGADERPWPWGDTFDESRCNCAEAGWGWTVAGGRASRGRRPVRRRAARRQRLGVGLATARRRLGRRQGRLATSTPARPATRAASCPPTPRAPPPTTGFRIVIDERREAWTGAS